MSKKKIGIIFGGKSGEHEVSLLSAASVIRAIDKSKFDLTHIGITKNGEWKLFKGQPEEIENGSWEKTAEDFNPGELKKTVEFALPILHGPNGEDGKIQGLFEMLDMPYGGCGVLASAVAMDKAIAKDVFDEYGLPICNYAFTTKDRIESSMEEVLDEIENKVGYPNFVKPANMGSSVGVSKAADRSRLREALILAVQYDRRIVIEENINCREIETAIIGNENPKAAAVGEIMPSAEFYDYTAKYLDGGESKLCIPANLPEDTYEKIRELAIKAYKAIDGEGFARVDFFIDRDTGKIYLNEINTIPGFTKYSMFPLLWEEAGVKYPEAIERIIELGYERYYNKNLG